MGVPDLAKSYSHYVETANWGIHFYRNRFGGNLHQSVLFEAEGWYVPTLFGLQAPHLDAGPIELADITDDAIRGKAYMTKAYRTHRGWKFEFVLSGGCAAREGFDLALANFGVKEFKPTSKA